MFANHGKVITALGLVEPGVLGRVMMHEHLYSDSFNRDTGQTVNEEKPMSQERHDMLMRDAIPFLKKCNDYGCHAFVDPTMPPWRAWPTFYPEASRASDMHIILSTGFYREIELGQYWAKTADMQIWPYVRKSSVEELTDMCIREIVEGLHGTNVRAGAIKLGTSQAVMTPAEQKTFRAGARAQKATGVHITTHCTQYGAESTQLQILDDEGVDLNRVAIGHIGWALGEAPFRETALEWMKRGATFLATNLGIDEKDHGERWRPLVNGIHEVFNAGCGDRLGFGLDWAFCSEDANAVFGPCSYIPGPPYLHMFTHTLPTFRKMGLTSEEETWIMEKNPQRILPVQ